MWCVWWAHLRSILFWVCNRVLLTIINRLYIRSQNLFILLLEVCDLWPTSPDFPHPPTPPPFYSLFLYEFSFFKYSPHKWDHTVFITRPLTQSYSKRHSNILQSPFLCPYLAPHQLLPLGNGHTLTHTQRTLTHGHAHMQHMCTWLRCTEFPWCCPTPFSLISFCLPPVSRVGQ